MLSATVQWYIFVGVLLVSVAALRPLLERSWLAPVHIHLLAGILVGPWCLGLLQIDLLRDAKQLEVLTEIAVIISLYSAGIKLRIPLTSGRWIAPLLLASLTMLVTVIFTAIVGGWLLGLSLAGAVLLGATLAPTDPVLAEKIQVEHTRDGDRMRQSLTGEAGLNDGTAFPFVLLAVGLADNHLHDLGQYFERWVAIDLLWKVLGGLGLGAITGYWVGRVIVSIRRRYAEQWGAEELLTIGLIAVVYGAALAIETYAFLAVFAAAVGLRHIELQRAAGAEQDSAENRQAQEDLVREQTAVAAALERVAQVFLVVIVGVLISSAQNFNVKFWIFAILMIAVIRPLAVLLTLHAPSITATQRGLIAWFGIRGIGTMYYLAHAISLGVAEPLVVEITTIISACVVTITASIFLHGMSDTVLMKWYKSKPSAH